MRQAAREDTLAVAGRGKDTRTSYPSLPIVSFSHGLAATRHAAPKPSNAALAQPALACAPLATFSASASAPAQGLIGTWHMPEQRGYDAHIDDLEGVCDGAVAMQQVQPLRGLRASDVQILLLEGSCAWHPDASTKPGARVCMSTGSAGW